MSPILLATDLTPWCDRAKQRALALAHRDKRPLQVLYVASGSASDPKVQADLAAAKAQITKMLATEAADLDTGIVLRSGEAWEEIAAQAEEIGAGLVVLGRHRRGGLRDVFMAPTASRVETGPPVLQATNLSAGDWKSVIVGTDFSPLAHQALAEALTLAPHAAIHLLHVFETPFAGFITSQADQDTFTHNNREALERAAFEATEALGLQGRNIDLALARGEVVSTLHAETRRLDCDLLVIGVAGHGGQNFGSTARSLTLDPPCDLLVVRPRGS